MARKIIEVVDVSMQFKLEQNKEKSLKGFMVAALQKKIQYEVFQALEDISFSVKKGEVLGIIGKNGAGKSTLLKIISGIMKPTKGKVEVKGNIVPMLELGSGFDFELTGRENIFLNGAILGYSKEYLKQKYKEIVNFSELERFIDTPIRNYSSGMMMRLAFSIATVVNPEVLIVDEILSVGDASFQEKSRTRMLELMGGGTTVFFVSHDLSQIEAMCNRVLWLQEGKVKMIGNTEAVCAAYKNCYG
ncbi:MAG: ABC transporter ATP-binding protein [Lachnospiraceae bacterium]|nr:ABC transporter ATP-binding protein [Lachnospiraceae bacterium]